MTVSPEVIQKFIELTNVIRAGNLEKNYKELVDRLVGELQSLGLELKRKELVFPTLAGNQKLDPIQLAVYFELVDFIEPLKDAGCDINASGGSELPPAFMPPLFMAVNSGRLDLVNAVLHAGGDIHKIIRGHPALHDSSIIMYVCSSKTDLSKFKDIVETLVKAGASFRAESEALIMGASYSNLPPQKKKMEYYLHYGVNVIDPVSGKWWYQSTESSVSLKNELTKAARELIEMSQTSVVPPKEKVDSILSTLKTGLNGRAQDGKTALHFAIENNPTLAEILIKNGASFDITNDSGLTPENYIDNRKNHYLKALVNMERLKKMVASVLDKSNLSEDTKVTGEKSMTPTVTAPSTPAATTAVMFASEERTKPVIFSGLPQISPPMATVSAAVLPLASLPKTVTTPITLSAEEIAAIERQAEKMVNFLETDSEKDPKLRELRFELGILMVKNPNLFPNSYHLAYKLLQGVDETHPQFKAINTHLYNILLRATASGFILNADMDGNAVELVRSTPQSSSTDPAALLSVKPDPTSESLRIDTMIKHLLASDSDQTDIIGSLMAQRFGLPMRGHGLENIQNSGPKTMFDLYRASQKLIGERNAEIEKLKRELAALREEALPAPSSEQEPRRRLTKPEK